MTGFVIAHSLRSSTGEQPWEVIAGTADRPAESEVRFYRQRFRNSRVHVFPHAAWDALPMGAQDSDWVSIGNRRIPRFDDGVRPD